MSQERRIKMQCTECKQINYHDQKNPRLKDRLEKSKFCKHCVKEETSKKGKHTLHKETK